MREKFTPAAEVARIRQGEQGTIEGDRFGLFVFRMSENRLLTCIATDGEGGDETGVKGAGDWEHVSVSVRTKSHRNPKWVTRTPSWDEMCYAKDQFWSDEECVIQFHPPASEYINDHVNVLHMWKNKNEIHRTPPTECV